jgi:hypothetical protein
MSIEMISIPKKEYDRLVDDSVMLNALMVAGVDNWAGYSEALAAAAEDADGG